MVVADSMCSMMPQCFASSRATGAMLPGAPGPPCTTVTEYGGLPYFLT